MIAIEFIYIANSYTSAHTHTQMVEKCRRYWPSKVGYTMKFPHTSILVTLKESKPFADYDINTLIVKRVRTVVATIKF